MYFCQTYLEGALSRRKGSVIEEMQFDGIESLTDSVFYIMYKYFSEPDIWANLRRIILNTCRYVTDFGLELLSRCVCKNVSDLIDPNKLFGCTQLFNYIHGTIESGNFSIQDIFTADTFNGLSLQKDEPNFNKDKYLNNIFKCVIVNESSLDLISFLKNGREVTRDSKLPVVLNFDQISFGNVENRMFNVFEINSVSLISLEQF